MTGTYEDIIGLPRHISKTRPRMAVIDRAAQFSPFAALTGYDAAIRETARLTEARIELDECAKSALNGRLQIIAAQMDAQPEITITYFRPDAKKHGGAYVSASGAAKKIDEYARLVTMAGGAAIPFDEIIGIDGPLFQTPADL